jgi:AraC-like DNA-binding protein/mannose-6-phosphate isomerase-like protein (cupin superfamily)
MSIPSLEADNPIGMLMKLDYDESMITFCKRFNQSSPIWNLERHSHVYTELMFFLRGTATIDTGDEILSPTSYDVVVYFPNHEHHETIDLLKPQEIICIWVDTGNLPLKDGAFRLRDVDRTLEWLFVRIEKEYRRGDSISKKLVTCYLNAIFQNMCRQLLQTEYANESNLAEIARDYIKDNFTQAISVQRLAEHCHVSRSYLHRVFQRRTGMTPVQYINSLRILEAEYLLESSVLSVAQIAEHCGFEESRYFCRVFRKQTGYTPSQYREKSK